MNDNAIKGPGFPFAINASTGSVGWSTDNAKLLENVRLILGTRIGERPLNRNFGTPLRDLVNEPNEGGLARLIARHVREALTQLEPRILVTDINFQTHGGELSLVLNYTTSNRPQAETILIPLG